MANYKDKLSSISNETPEEGFKPLQQEFIIDRSSELLEIKQAINTNNYERIRVIAHNWRGFSKPYGFHFLSDIAVNMEKAAINNDSNSCKREYKIAIEYLSLKKNYI